MLSQHYTEYQQPRLMRAAFDGSYDPIREVAASGWLLEAAWKVDDLCTPLWELVAQGARQCRGNCAMAAEMMGANQVLKATCAFARFGRVAFDEEGWVK